MSIERIDNQRTTLITDKLPVMLPVFFAHRIFDVYDGLGSFHCGVFLRVAEDALEGVGDHCYDQVEDDNERDEHVGAG